MQAFLLSPQNWSAVSIVPPLKKRLKKVLAPAARQFIPTLSRIAGTAPLPEDQSPKDDAFIHAYRALEREFPSADSAGNGKGTTPPTKAAVRLKVAAARKSKSTEPDLDQLAHGSALDTLVLQRVRHLIRRGDRHKAVAMGHSLRSHPDTRNMGTAVLGVALLGSSGPANSWKVFAEIVNTPASDQAADELYAAAFGKLGQDAAPFLDADIESGRVEHWDAATLLHVAQKALARGLTNQTRTLIAVAQTLPEALTTKHITKEVARLATWLPEGSRRAEIPVIAGTINFGIMGYEQPDVTSRNIGDYIQTVASMGHIVRQRNFAFAGDTDLVEIAEELRATTKTERMLDGPTANLNLLELNRDGNPYQALPEKTWALSFGWHMHDTFNQGFGIPFHENLRPILISIYVRYPSMLTAEAITYLRKYAPVGCRDWQTVALLRAVGVPAFFSGCLTTTVDTVFRRDTEDLRNSTIYVDSPQTGPGDSRTQAQTGIRALSFVENLRLARDWVSHYHLEYNNVVTSRLHCFLPARAVGSTVTFLPKNRSDNRFGGLIDTTDDEFEQIRQGILSKVSTMLQTIATAPTEDAVYEKWREICSPAMAEADEYLAASTLRVLKSSDLRPTREVLVSASSPVGDAKSINVIVDVRRGELEHVPRLLRSIARHTSRSVQIWVVADNVTDAERISLLDRGLALPISWISPSATTFDSLQRSAKQATRQELALALAAEAIPEGSQAIFLPAAALVRSDLSTLAAQGPAENHLVSAADDRHRGRQSGLDLIRRVATRQGKDNQGALNFVFASHHGRKGDFTAFDPNVMVVNLELARSHNLSGHLVSLILDYGMTFREAINTFAGNTRANLDLAWNHAPGYEVQVDPAIVNWRDTSKPWNSLKTPFAEEWNIS